jgi:hypothetical protein
MTKGVFITDEHFPFQDEKARQIALQIVQDYRPDVVIVGSDGMDFYPVSTFDKNPDRVKIGMQEEIDTWKTGIKEWKSASPKKAQFRFIAGNHEDRLRRYLYRHPELYGLQAITLRSILGLDDQKIQWDEETNEVTFFNRLVVKHGMFARKWSGMSVKAEMENERFQMSIIMGHCHKGGSFMTTTRDGIIQGQEGFCLCSLNPEFIQRPDWQQGIVMFDVTEDYLSIDAVPITSFRDRKQAIWRGKEYV